MANKLKMYPASIESTVRQQWLDKLWAFLFDGGAGGLMSPGQIRRENRDRFHVRQLEMAAILEAEKELNAIHDGTKELDEKGNVVNTPPVEHVSTHHIIENPAIEQDLDIGLDSPAAMIRSVVKELSVRDLERSLNVRKIAILAENEILNCEIRAISTQAVSAEWARRWRECAENIFNPDLQLLWARALIYEVAQPESYSLGLMTVLQQLHRDDYGMLVVAAKYTFPTFIFNAASGYFNTEFHHQMLEVLEDLNLLNLASQSTLLRSDSSDTFSKVLPCQGKALQISAEESTATLTLPVLKLSRMGRQLFTLVNAEADLAYLYNMANYVKEQGFQLAMGDWRDGHFHEKMKL